MIILIGLTEVGRPTLKVYDTIPLAWVLDFMKRRNLLGYKYSSYTLSPDYIQCDQLPGLPLMKD